MANYGSQYDPDWYRKDDGQAPAKMPHNVEAEQALLGALLVNNKVYHVVSGIIGPEDFFDPVHGAIFEEAAERIRAGGSATPITLINVREQIERVGEFSMMQYLARLVAEATTIINSRDFAETIAEMSRLRRLVVACDKAIEAAMTPDLSRSSVAVMTHLQADLLNTVARERDLGIYRLDEVANEVLDDLNEAFKSDETRGIQLGLACVQNLTGPLLPERVYLVPGPPGSGKSALAHQIGMTVAGQGKVVLNFSIEMSRKEVAIRELAYQSKVTASQIDEAKFNMEEFQRIYDSVQQVKGLPYIIVDHSKLTMPTLRGIVDRTKELHGLDLVIIDHLLHLPSENPRAGEWSRIGENLKAIKAMTRQLKVPAIVLTQLKQSYLDGDIRPPRSNDIMGGSSNEQDVDVILFVFREDVILRRREPKDQGSKEYVEWQTRLEEVDGKAFFSLGKRRSGVGSGKQVGYFHGETMHFSDFPPGSRTKAQSSFFGEDEQPF